MIRPLGYPGKLPRARETHQDSQTQLQELQSRSGVDDIIFGGDNSFKYHTIQPLRNK